MEADVRNWLPQRLLTVGYAIAIAVLVLNAIITFQNLGTIRRSWNTLIDGREFVRGIDRILADLTEAETGQRGYILTGDVRYLEPYTRSHAEIPELIQQLRLLAGDNPTRLRHLKVVAERSAAKLTELEKAISARATDGIDAAIAIIKSDTGKAEMEQLRSELGAMQAEEEVIRAPVRQNMRSAINRTTLTFLFASAAALALLFVVHFLSERSRERLRRDAAWLTTTLCSIGDAVIATDNEGSVRFMNVVAERLTGWTNADATGKPLETVFQISNEADGAPIESPVAKVLRDGAVVGLANHTVLTARDRTARPIEDSAAPIQDRDRVFGVVLVFRDATDARHAERRISESEERYRSLVAATTQTVWLASPDFRRSSILTGQIPDGFPAESTLATQNWLERIHPDDRARTLQTLAEAQIARSAYEIRHRMQAADGTFRHLLVRAVPLVDGEGAIREWVGTTSDVTERSQVEDARERLYQEIRENNKRKDEFLAMLAHELRNPVAAIASAVMLATRSGVHESIDWSLHVIDRQVKHLTRLIDDLLDVSRISRGKIDLRRELVDLTGILDSAVQTVQPILDEREHRLATTIDRGALWVDADPTRLEQVLINLLTNAAKYTDKSGSIELKAQRAGNEVVIKVKDSGIGIAPEKLPEIFELFAQGDRTLARSEGGLGIGLTLVKRLVEAHGGTVTALSDGVGKGSEFSVRLPLAKPALPGKPQVRERPPAQGTSSKILIVDDNVDMARALAGILSLHGHDVATVDDGPAAIDAARKYEPSVVLLDIGLPGMDGYKVVEILKNDWAAKGTLFIAISGYGQDSDKRRSHEAGFDHHLVKPIDHHELLALVGRKISV
jgi:PAS domain S-box-containing protein